MSALGFEAEPASVDVSRAAGFWRRLGAAVVDGLVIGVVQGILVFSVGEDAAAGLTLLIALGYFTYFHGSTGQTWGTRCSASASSTTAVERAGRSVSRAFVRWLVSIVSGAVIAIGYLWMLWDRDRQTWHDKAAGSLPVHTRR